MATTTLFRSVSCLVLEPLKHTHAMPPFIFLSFSHSLQTPTKLFSAAFYSTLKSPISPPPSFETTPIARFLLSECGFSLHEANTICAKRPDLLGHKSYDNSRQTLLFLRDKSFHEIGIRKFFSRYPDTLRFSFQDTVKPKVEFLEKIGLTGQKLSKTLERCPAILSLSVSGTLEPRVCFLKSVLDPKLAAAVSNPESDKTTGKLVSNCSLTASVIYLNPRILALSTEKFLAGLVKDVEEMGIEKGSKAFARIFGRLSMLNRDTAKRKFENLRELGFTEEQVGIILKKFPAFVSLSEDTTKRKWENLGELGFTEEEIVIILQKFPSLLGFSKDKLQRNFKFLVEEWKLPRNAILIYPMSLGLSTEKRLKPRLQSLMALMTKKKSSKEAESYPPVHYMLMSDRDFHCKVVSRLPVENEEKKP